MHSSLLPHPLLPAGAMLASRAMSRARLCSLFLAAFFLFGHSDLPKAGQEMIFPKLSGKCRGCKVLPKSPQERPAPQRKTRLAKRWPRSSRYRPRAVGGGGASLVHAAHAQRKAKCSSRRFSRCALVLVVGDAALVPADSRSSCAASR